MGASVTIALSDDQAIGLIRLAATSSMTLENQVLCLIEFALIDHNLLPTHSLEEVLRDIEENPPQNPIRREQAS